MALQTLLGAALCVLPLFDVLGFESSLATALFGSLAVGLTTAGFAARLRSQLPVPAPSSIFAAALGAAALAALPPLLLLLANGTRVRNCNVFEGLSYYAVVALPSLAIGAAWGALLGIGATRPRRARLAFFVVWLGSILWTLGRFYGTPAVYGYDPFFGFFPGTLYDSVVRIGAPLLTYRVGTAIEIASLGLAAIAFGTRRLSLSARPSKPGAALLLLILLAARVALYVAGPALHHRTSSADLVSALGVHRTGPRCAVVADGRIAPGDVARFLEDCEFQLGEVEHFFGRRLRGRVTAFLFRNETQKGQLLGAAETFIAKPWRREVYLQAQGFPHPVLEHEIAHVVAGEFARRPFRVSATAAGLWPRPGLIEGAAVAAGWERDELTPHQWARAMRDAGLRPDPARAIGLSFMTSHSGAAYTVAGSFSRFLVERHGRARFRRAYRSGSLEEAYGRPVGALVREWNEFLGGVAVSPFEAEVARHRFDRPSLFGRVCAREVARLESDAGRAAEAGDMARAIRALGALCRHDPDNPAHRMGLFEMMVRSGRTGRARSLAADLAGDDRVGIVARGQVEERVADLEWLSGSAQAAAERYAELALRAGSDNERRMRLVKARAAAHPLAGPLVRRFLLERDGQPEAPPLGVATLHALVGAAPDWGIGSYLLGRQLFNQDDFERAAPLFARALEIGLTDEPIEFEARRVLAISLYRTGQLEESRAQWTMLANDDRRPRGARDEAASWVRRCDWAAGPGRRLAAAQR